MIDFGKNAQENTFSSDKLLQMKMGTEDNKTRLCLLMMSIAQKRTGDHKKSLETITKCITQYPEYKDAYLVRGQTYLLSKQYQRALQDFIKFDQLVSESNNQLQIAIAKESLGDAYKSM